MNGCVVGVTVGMRVCECECASVCCVRDEWCMIVICECVKYASCVTV